MVEATDEDAPPPMRLNIGCGGAYRLGYVNIDATNPVADVQADAAHLPFDDSSAERIDLIHVVEHLTYARAIHALSEAYRVLRPNGLIVIETPCPEGAFESFLSCRAQEHRAQLLSWIFGLDTPGYPHRLLYPFELLEHTLESAGFEKIEREEPKHHLYSPGLRVVARRRGLPTHLMLSHLRRWTTENEALDLSHQLEALEFETTFVDRVLGLGGAQDPPPDGTQAVLENILMAPQVALRWLESCGSYEGALSTTLAHLASLAQAAVAEELRGRMESLFRGVLANGTDAKEGYQHLCDVGLSVLRETARATPQNQRSRLDERLPPPAAQQQANTPFSRTGLEQRVQSLHDMAVRHLSQGRLDEGIAMMRQAANAKIHPLYPMWNIAVAQASRGIFDEAIRLYRECIDLATDRVETVLLRELALCYLHAGDSEDALALLSDHPDQELDGLLEIARSVAVDRKEADDLLPPLRSHPVLSGESLYHEPEPT